MPRNTFIVISLLAVLAALVVGVNMGRRLGNPANTSPSPSIATSPSPTPTPTPPSTTAYASTRCGVQFDYPVSFIKQEASSSAAAALFIDPQNGTNIIIFTCQKEIPRPALPSEKIETIAIGSTSAKLYHDTNAKDGSSIDKLILHHPKTGLDVFIAGLGPAFQQVISSLKIL